MLVSLVPLLGGLHHLLLQPGGGKGASGPEEAGPARGPVPAALPGVFLQPKA